MDLHFLIQPKNPNLSHCPDSLENAIDLLAETCAFLVCSRVDKFVDVVHLYKSIISSNVNSRFYVYLFSTQPEYPLFLISIKILCFLIKREVVIIHQMHEPWYEKGRASLIQRCLVYVLNSITSKLCDKIILPSEQALLKARLFGCLEKLYMINLTFLRKGSLDQLKASLVILKYSWNISKTVSLIGGTGPDRNPEGFLSLSIISNEKYQGEFSYVRAGRDKKVSIDYKKFGIVEFSGYLTESAKQFLLLQTHFIVVPYAFSTQSGVIAEALSYGKLLIVNDIPAFDYLKSYEFAYVIDFSDPNKISNCLEKIRAIEKEDYERRYWLAIDYFQKNHSEEYLSHRLNEMLYQQNY
jgi:hypothetical protein